MRPKLGSLLRRLIPKPAAPPLLNRDLDSSDFIRLLADMRLCLSSPWASLTTRRRLSALVSVYGGLTPHGQARFAELFDRLDHPEETGSERYSVFEETELFGSPASKLSILQAFEPPRRRMIALVAATPGGPELLGDLKQYASCELRTEIDRLTLPEC